MRWHLLVSGCLVLLGSIGGSLLALDAQNAPLASEELLEAQKRKSIVWSADFESGDLSQWVEDGTRGGPRLSGLCTVPSRGVSTEQARSGRYSMKMTIDTSKGSAGCRQARNEEIGEGGDYYYSAWYYLPSTATVTGSFNNVFQFKSESKSTRLNEVIWALDILNRPTGEMYLSLRWKGSTRGPQKGDGTARKVYTQTKKNVPAGKWFHVEVYLRQSNKFGGRLTVWQNGVKLYDLKGVRTKYPDGDGRWLVNNYSDGLRPNPFTMYIDDVIISTRRIGP